MTFLPINSSLSQLAQELSLLITELQGAQAAVIKLSEPAAAEIASTLGKIGSNLGTVQTNVIKLSQSQIATQTPAP